MLVVSFYRMFHWTLPRQVLFYFQRHPLGALLSSVYCKLNVSFNFDLLKNRTFFATKFGMDCLVFYVWWQGKFERLIGGNKDFERFRRCNSSYRFQVYCWILKPVLGFLHFWTHGVEYKPLLNYLTGLNPRKRTLNT